jgi:hypothetical protein
LRVSGKRELRYQQQAALNVAKRQVHPTLNVRKDAIRKDPLQQPICGNFVVTSAHTNEREHPTLNSAHRLRPNLYICPGDSLNQCDHGAFCPRLME